MELLAHEAEYTDDYRMALTTAQYENEYDRVHARTLQLLDAERGRIQCMERLLLQIENESLQMRLDQMGEELVQARENESDARLQFHGASREVDRLQGIAQASSREIESLRRELASLNSVASESQQLQAEKFRLSKEISNLQSEVERLGSQNTSANALLAEKQALTRQLNAVEVQLEHEKRAHERTLAKGSKQAEEIASLTSKLEETRHELELAHRHRQDLAPQSRELTAHQAPFDNKTEGSNIKLVPLKDHDPEAAPDPEKQGRGSMPSAVPLQRLATRLNPELTIATPGAVRAQSQQKRSAALPGDKSSFSITPFLNRTSGLEEPTMSSDDELNELQNVGDDSHLVNLSNRNRHGDDTAARLKQLKPTASRQLYKPGKQASTNAAFDGEMKNGKRPKTSDSPDGVGGYGIPPSRTVSQKQAQSRKRKLGMQRGMNLFDEEDEDNTFPDVKKTGRRPVGTGQITLPGNRAFTGFSDFSPLKRDRKRL